MTEMDVQCEPNTEGLMTLKDLAHYLRASEKFARTLYTRQGLPYVRLGKCIRFRREAVDGYLIAHEVVTEIAH